MSEIDEPEAGGAEPKTAEQDSGAVLGLQDIRSEEEDVVAHSVGCLSATSVMCSDLSAS
jgi:hypothetical protein